MYMAWCRNHLQRLPLTVGVMDIAIEIPQGDQAEAQPAMRAAPKATPTIRSRAPIAATPPAKVDVPRITIGDVILFKSVSITGPFSSS